MKIPWAALIFAAALLIPYFWLSGGTLYLPDDAVLSLAFGAPQSAGVFTHMFFHVGLNHLLGNLIPLVLFAIVLEEAVAWFDVVFIFVASGMFASLLFSFLNPGSIIIGASAGVSGLMAAAVMVKPKKALALLIAVPLLVTFLVFPVSNFFVQWQLDSKNTQISTMEQQVTTLVSQNKTTEAAQVTTQLKQVEDAYEREYGGRQRESSTPTDFLVHAFGALFGAGFIAFFRRDALQEGYYEFQDLGRQLNEKIDQLRRR
ncbi:Rhomboid family protein [Candidatus Norongarragalina meridionalis]|nr:Rhomboid family protein [Candidatus Norongarragalina meridionalis]